MATTPEVLKTARTGEDIYTASQFRLMWRRFRRHRVAVISSIIVLVLYFIAGFGDFLSTYDPYERHLDHIYLAPPDRSAVRRLEVRAIRPGRQEPSQS